MEHFFASQLMGHLNASNIFYALQHGFRDKRSCETQLLSLVHELANGVNANKQTDMAILDFSKAFDKVSHKLLLYKLTDYKWLMLVVHLTYRRKYARLDKKRLPHSLICLSIALNFRPDCSDNVFSHKCIDKCQLSMAQYVAVC